MACIEQRHLLQDGTPLMLRSARAKDAEAFIHYLEAVAGESENLAISQGEQLGFEQEDRYMEELANAPNAIFLLALVDEAIVGALTFTCGKRPKLSRSGEFGLSVSKAWWGKGIGSLLLQALVDWAPGAGIGKIHLQVRSDNERAIAIYRRFGFVDEAVIRHQFFIDGQYHDLLWMGLKLGTDTPRDVPVPYVMPPPAILRTPVQIRTARPEDAAAILVCLDKICQETEFMSMGTEGPAITLEEERNFLANAQHDPGSLYLIALAQDEAVGFLSFTAGKRQRIRHAGEFSLAIRKDYGGMGIGKAMMHRLIHWAEGAGIHKINLEVRTENKLAVELYQKCGFTIEGLISRTVFYNGGYHDSYAMGLILPLDKPTT
ncbi:MAG: hypothetical protein CVV52_13075 [Spirochaetae bacterium HGW-Spirochaetae-8]|jgi:RimJ/RimL family protein N-acetyltransferase|nr:MAG: hypothetical protein CVV52_13075 [Spirochaetae bacterium HGW-Spirochaetae-8]